MIELRAVRTRFGEQVVIDGVDFEEAAMKKAILLTALGIVTVLVTAHLANAGSQWSVAFWQAGLPTTEVQCGVEFQIRGEGFHNDVHPVKVCLFDNQCQLATPDRSGVFVVNRTIPNPGEYEIRVFQARDTNISEWRMKASGRMTVTN